MMRIIAIILLCLLSTPACAGAWQRAKGSWFSTTSSSWDRSGAYSSAYYAEYGLAEWLTIGVDGGVSALGEISALVFTRTQLWATENAHHLALEIAGGTSAGRPMVRPGASYGRGFNMGRMQGWMAIDVMAAIDLWTNTARYKMDSSVGLRPNDRWKIIFQAQTEVQPGLSHTLKLAPSVVRRVGKHVDLELGVTETVLGRQGTALKLGFWLEY